jgi:hypothetical protein
MFTTAAHNNAASDAMGEVIRLLQRNVAVVAATMQKENVAKRHVTVSYSTKKKKLKKLHVFGRSVVIHHYRALN